MKIINKYHKRLSWDNPEFVFSIDTNEIKDVPNNIASHILRNKHIKRVEFEAKQNNKENKQDEIKNKQESKIENNIKKDIRKSNKK